jgi:hypothetical protein
MPACYHVNYAADPHAGHVNDPRSYASDARHAASADTGTTYDDDAAAHANAGRPQPLTRSPCSRRRTRWSLQQL